MTRAELERLVEEAFRDSEYPGDDRLIDSAVPQHVLDPEAAEIREAFVRKNWQDVDRKDFIGWPQAISFFTSIAFVYYLPGILLATLDLDAESGYFTESFIRRLTADNKRQSDFTEITDLLSPEQKRIIAKYLKLVTQEPFCD